MGDSHAIAARQLTKTYRTREGDDVVALQGIDLKINNGEIYALLGPNGAGKTTAISILTTLLLPTSGQATVAGFDVAEQPAEVRRRIGITFQEMVLDEELTGRRVLDFHGRLYGESRERRRLKIEELSDLVELSDVLDRAVKSYSGGMKRRLELARGLMTAPSILFLDEPTQGLDPQNRVGIWRYIRRLRDEQGMTLLLTTHYMEEAETLADRVGIIDRGRLIVEGTPSELIRQLGADVIAMIGRGSPEQMVQQITAEPYVSQINEHRADEDELLIQIGVDIGERRLPELIRIATDTGFHVHEVSVAKPTLGDVFLAHTGHALRDT